jgi:lipopolysaccharide export system protein LptC
MTRRWSLLAVLMLTALLASWAAWLLRIQPPPPEDAGPPRSDYTLDDYRLVVLNKEGTESFTSVGPYLARDPYNETLSLNQPRFSFPSHDGKGNWTSGSDIGWVSPHGEEVRLIRSVVLDGPVVPQTDQTHLRTEEMTVHPQPQTAHSDLLVTVTRGASILRGTGMNANLKTDRLELLSKVSLHNATVHKN